MYLRIVLGSRPARRRSRSRTGPDGVDPISSEVLQVGLPAPLLFRLNRDGPSTPERKPPVPGRVPQQQRQLGNFRCPQSGKIRRPMTIDKQALSIKPAHCCPSMSSTFPTRRSMRCWFWTWPTAPSSPTSATPCSWNRSQPRRRGIAPAR